MAFARITRSRISISECYTGSLAGGAIGRNSLWRR